MIVDLLNKILEKGGLDNELDFERAIIVNRQIRVISKTQPGLVEKRSQLRTILQEYEDRVWANGEITDHKVMESELAEKIAEQELLKTS